MKNRKTVSFILFAVTLLAIISYPAFGKIGNAVADSASSNAEFVIGMDQYFVNNQLPGISMDAAPYIDSGRTLVPVRYLADALGATTNWDGNTQEVTVSTAVYNIGMTIGSPTLTLDGQAQMMDVAPLINNGRTYLPARWVANALGYQVDWNAQYQIVIIWPNGTPEPDYSNVIQQAQQKPTVIDGFNIPAGTHLTVDPTSGQPLYYSDGTLEAKSSPMDIAIYTTKGDVQGQVADAQNILSQAQDLDPSTIATVMTTVNHDLANIFPWKGGGINSPNGGSVVVAAQQLDNNGNIWVDIQIRSDQLPSSFKMIN
jgi:hypothetical protein